jgi:hypothetical protein
VRGCKNQDKARAGKKRANELAEIFQKELLDRSGDFEDLYGKAWKAEDFPYIKSAQEEAQ